MLNPRQRMVDVSRNRVVVDMNTSSGDIRDMLQPYIVFCITEVEGVGSSVGTSVLNMPGDAAGIGLQKCSKNLCYIPEVSFPFNFASVSKERVQSLHYYGPACVIECNDDTPINCYCRGIM